jgi:hypothetical protein
MMVYTYGSGNGRHILDESGLPLQSICVVSELTCVATNRYYCIITSDNNVSFSCLPVPTPKAVTL